MYLGEAGRPLYDPQREVWTRWASLTAVVLALAAALAACTAAVWGMRAHLEAGREQRLRVDYQALTSKAEALKHSRDFFTLHRLLEHKNAKAQKLIEGKLRDYEEELIRGEKEREHLKAEAGVLGGQRERWARQAAGSARTAFLLFLATMLAAAGTLGKRKLFWLAALIFGVAGAASFLGGVFLWF